MSDEDGEIEELNQRSNKLIEEGQKLSERHRELVDELKNEHRGIRTAGLSNVR
jgi:hypothetical protein